MTKRGDYTYLSLEDAKKAAGQKVSLFAAVTEIGVPRRSRGTVPVGRSMMWKIRCKDYVLTLKIADQSHHNPGLSINFFSEHQEKLPHVKSSGDIICLRCVTIGIYKGEVYSVFNKKLSSFALFEGKTGTDFTPYQISATFHGLPQDNEFIRELRTWLLIRQSDSDVYTLQLKGIKTDQVFDLVCKVLHACETSEGEWVLFVWDGTDTPPLSFQMDLDLEGEIPCPLHVEALSLSRDVLCAFPHVGSILRVFSGIFFEEIPQLRDGIHWVRLRNITCEVHSAMWKGMLHPSSKIRLLSDEDDAVLARQRFYNERISSEAEFIRLRRPFSSYPRPSHVTETDYEQVIDATLMDSLTHPEVIHKFKCVIRVVSAYPWKTNDLCSRERGHYRLRLTLEDPTARIHAYIHGEDGVKFFGGYPPAEDLAVKMNKLLGISEVGESDVTEEGNCAVRNPPWVWFCLKSYYADKSDPWGSRKYRVFGTKLVG